MLTIVWILCTAHETHSKLNLKFKEYLWVAAYPLIGLKNKSNYPLVIRNFDGTFQVLLTNSKKYKEDHENFYVFMICDVISSQVMLFNFIVYVISSQFFGRIIFTSYLCQWKNYHNMILIEIHRDFTFTFHIHLTTLYILETFLKVGFISGILKAQHPILFTTTEIEQVSLLASYCLWKQQVNEKTTRG